MIGVWHSGSGVTKSRTNQIALAGVLLLGLSFKHLIRVMDILPMTGQCIQFGSTPSSTSAVAKPNVVFRLCSRLNLTLGGFGLAYLRYGTVPSEQFFFVGFRITSNNVMVTLAAAVFICEYPSRHFGLFFQQPRLSSGLRNPIPRSQLILVGQSATILAEISFVHCPPYYALHALSFYGNVGSSCFGLARQNQNKSSFSMASQAVWVMLCG